MNYDDRMDLIACGLLHRIVGGTTIDITRSCSPSSILISCSSNNILSGMAERVQRNYDRMNFVTVAYTTQS